MAGESEADADDQGKPLPAYRVEAGALVPGTWLILPTGRGHSDAPLPLKRFTAREQADEECDRLNALWVEA